jgi:hypothetical protein
MGECRKGSEEAKKGGWGFHAAETYHMASNFEP